MRARKTKDVWEVQGNYGQSWECVYASEDRKDARERLKEYDQNERGYAHKIVKTRERITEAA